MFFSLRKLMPQLLICVVLENKSKLVRIHRIKKNEILETDEKIFDSQDRLLAYIQNLIKETPLYYLALFFADAAQGVFLENSKNELKEIERLKIGGIEIYASLKSLERCKNSFESCGVDFIFSPFALLYYCIQKEQILDKNLTTLCVYKHSECIAVMIFKGNQVLFGSFFETQMKKFPELELEENENSNENSDFNLETDYDVKELDSMLKDKLEHLEEHYEKDKLENFGNDMTVCRYIISSITEFYNNPNYESNFIDDFVIFDNENITKATLEYIENEIFLTPKVVKIDTLELMNELMRKELKI